MLLSCLQYSLHRLVARLWPREKSGRNLAATNCGELHCSAGGFWNTWRSAVPTRMAMGTASSVERPLLQRTHARCRHPELRWAQVLPRFGAMSAVPKST